IVSAFLREGEGEHRSVSLECSATLCETSFAAYEPAIERATAGEKKLGPRTRVLEVLAAHAPKKYCDVARDSNLTMIGDSSYGGAGVKSCNWLVKTFGAGIVASIVPQLQRIESRSLWVCNDLEALAGLLGAASAPAMFAALKFTAHDVRIAALEHLLSWP